jgi:uncharacterized protein with HEPN domain
MSRDAALYISDLIESVTRIMDYTDGVSREQLDDDHEKVDAIIRNFEVLGIAARNLPDEVKERYSDIPWNDIVSLRNKVAHEYFAINLDIIWQTIKEDLPTLKHQLAQLTLDKAA